MITYHKLIYMYKDAFKKKGMDLQVAKAFLFELCNEKGIDLYLELDNDADREIIGKFEAGIKRILADEPLYYVLGYCYFFGYKLVVNKDVLIPRFETEELVGNILGYIDEYFKDQEVITAADIGTGSGAIAIALKKEEARLSMIATDISSEALDVAKRNALDNDAAIDFMSGDMLKPLIAKGTHVDILISNPPYIPLQEEIEVSVRDFEPHVALFGGSDGLDYYRQIFTDARKVLNERWLMAFEIGYNQKEALMTIAKEHFADADIEVLKDINGKDRMMFIKKI